MYRRLHHWTSTYIVVSRIETRRDFEYLRFDDPLRAEFLLRELWRDSLNRQSLCAVAYEHFGPTMAMRHDEIAIIQRLARALTIGSLRLATERRGTVRGTYGGSQNREAERTEATPPPETRKHSISALVVDDATSEPVSRVRIHVTSANGTRYTLGTDTRGIAEIRDVPAGSHQVMSPLSGATVATTLSFVGRGDAPTGRSTGETGSAASLRSSRTFCIANVTEHRVKTGETLSQIAKQHRLSVGELAYFNWGVYADQQIQERLRDDLGCSRRSKDGRFVFDDADDPGIIYIPGDWSVSGLAHDQRHTIRVRRIERPMPDLKFLYQIDAEAPEAKNDTLTLETEDGTWRHSIQVSSLTEIEPDVVELVFPQPPAGSRFNLIQDPGDGESPFYVFKCLSWGELRKLHADQVEHDEAE